MNIKSLLFMSCLAPSMAACQPVSKATFHVVDETGKSLAGAEVRTSTFSHWQGGQGFGQDINKLTDGLTDHDGKLSVEVQNTRGEFYYGASMSGHYALRSLRYKFGSLVNGRWQPWNPTIQIELKSIRNPIPLIAKRVSSGDADDMLMPADKAAYDLEIGDWTAPHGTGKTPDLIFEIFDKWVGAENDYDTTFKLSFSNPQDGLLQVKRPANHGDRPGQGSEMVMPYEAPLEGYAPAKNWRKVSIKPRFVNGVYKDPKLTSDTKPDEDYFLRLRTKVDENGSIISAHYAKVQDSFLWGASGYIRFKYYFNPAPNDRNLEFDPKRNLLSGEPFEKLTDP